MTSCEEFEIAIGMRQHGALDVAAVEELDRHLAGCESCRRFADSTQMTEKIMADSGFVLAQGMDWERVRGRIQTMADRVRWQMLALLVSFPLVAAWLLWTWRPGSDAMVAVTVATMIVIMLVLLLQQRKQRRDLRWAETAGPAGFRLYREQLDNWLLAARTMSQWGWIPPVIYAVMMAVDWMAVDWEVPRRMISGALMVVVFGSLWLHARFIERPRLERERAELGE